MMSAILMQIIIYKNLPAIRQFSKGLASLNLLDVCKANIGCMLPLFSSPILPVSKKSFRELLEIQFSPEGSNAREEEEASALCWEEYIDTIACEESAVSLEELLIFITGCKTIPPLGLPKKIMVKFYKEMGRLPSTSTCALEIYIPSGIDDFHEFERQMHRALKESHGFGKV